jgi:hypothetical protein
MAAEPKEFNTIDIVLEAEMSTLYQDAVAV